SGWKRSIVRASPRSARGSMPSTSILTRSSRLRSPSTSSSTTAGTRTVAAVAPRKPSPAAARGAAIDLLAPLRSSTGPARADRAGAIGRRRANDAHLLETVAPARALDELGVARDRLDRDDAAFGADDACAERREHADVRADVEERRAGLEVRAERGVDVRVVP